MNPQPPRLPGDDSWLPDRIPIPGQENLAGFGQRLAARLIDSVIPGGVTVLLFYAMRDTGVGSLFARYGPFLGFTLLNDGILTATKGGTIGKLLLGMRVVRLEDQSPVHAATAMRRWASLLVLAFIPFLGLVDSIWIFTGTFRQTLHDKFAETVVVHSRAS
jgi:uncharacterized RDD family membrane protein YckC